MKVLHIGKFFPPHRGGMETFLRDLMIEQQRQGLEVHALVHRSDRSLRSSRENYQRREQSIVVTRVGRWATLAFTPISPLFIWHIWRLIRREKPDILHLHMPNPSVFWCLLLPGARRVPWVIQWQSDVIASDLQLALRLLYRFYRIPERMMLKQAARVIASSPNYLESSETLKPHTEKCRVVPLAVEDPAVDSPVRAAKQAQTSVLSVLAVGRLTYYKGFDVLIQALPDCPEVFLDLVGDGEERASLEALCQKLGVAGQVKFLGNCVDDVLEALYASSDLFCLPSIERTESFGIVLLEAMSRGLPCVVADVAGSGMSWVVGGGDDSVLVPPGDPAALAKMLNSLNAERGILHSLGRCNRARFEQVFSLPQCVQRVSTLYSDVLKI